MSDDVMNEEFPDEKQRTGVCYDRWRKKGEKMEKESIKRDSEGRQIIAENVPIIFQGVIESEEE